MYFNLVYPINNQSNKFFFLETLLLKAQMHVEGKLDFVMDAMHGKLFGMALLELSLL